MKAQTQEFSGTGFDAFALVPETTPDPARLLADKEAAIEGKAAQKKAQLDLFETKPVSYHVPEVRVMTLREATVEAEPILNRPELCTEFFNSVVQRSEWFDAEKECVVVVHLNRRNRLKGFTMISLGTQTTCVLHTREVYRAAIIGNATAIVLFHNHPSGDPSPSAADVQITRQLREAAKTVDIEFLDHVIVGKPSCDPTGRGFYSFREAGHL